MHVDGRRRTFGRGDVGGRGSEDVVANCYTGGQLHQHTLEGLGVSLEERRGG